MVSVTAYAGKTVAVMGLGRAGLQAVRALLPACARVLAWDDAPAPRASARALGAVVTDLAVPGALAGAAALVLSPGIPHSWPAPHPVAAAAKSAGVPLTGDAALLAATCPSARYVGVTGTNGKSTTTALIAHILATAGLPVQAGGNLGEPAVSLAPLGAGGVYVIEMSSYQLELSPLRFQAAVLLNITPDHLDRHGGMDGYRAAKARIFACQQTGDAAIVGVDDATSAALAESLSRQGRRVVPVSVVRPVSGGVYAQDGGLVDDTGGDRRVIMALADAPRLPGLHNAQNMAAAYAVARILNIDDGVIREALRSYPGLPHRQEQVAVAGAVQFINDSKATNAQAAAKALSCYQNIFWIAGGVEKDGGYDDLTPFLPRIRQAFLIGQGAENIARALAGRVPAAFSGTLDRAMAAAFSAARASAAPAVVLLSPACASFDQFTSFEHRGDVFRELAVKLAAAPEGEAA